MKKLLIVDDSELIRSRLVGMLKRIPGIKEVGTANTVQQTLYCAAHFLPDLVILDLNLSDGNAIRMIPKLKRMQPTMQVAVLTNDASEFTSARCREAGADWFFDKSTEFEKVLDLVREQVTLH